MTPHLNVDVASLLTNHIEEPAQVGSNVQSQALMGKSAIRILLVVCAIWRQRCASGGYYPDLSKDGSIVKLLSVYRFKRILAVASHKMLRNELSAEQQGVTFWR